MQLAPEHMIKPGAKFFFRFVYRQDENIFPIQRFVW